LIELRERKERKGQKERERKREVKEEEKKNERFEIVITSKMRGCDGKGKGRSSPMGIEKVRAFA
jgi:hypothetical protein